MHPTQRPKSGEWTMDMDGRREDGMDVNGKMDLNSKTDVENKEEKREERLNKWLGQMGVCS